MIKKMTAKYRGRCAKTGAPIVPGDEIYFDTITRDAWITEEHGDPDGSRWVSNVFNIGGKEFYRNKKGRCEDAPCCGCCTI
jgi:hypothetical protein